MKRAFTLIELMISILLISIFSTFIFKFYTNVLSERYYLDAKDSLVYNSFRALEVIKNGVYGDDGNYIGGVITFHSSQDSNFSVEKGKLLIFKDSSVYIFNDINITDSNISLNKINNGLYSIEFNATKNSILRFNDLNQTDIVEYQRLVYIK